jgi:hypothetical protein
MTILRDRHNRSSPYAREIPLRLYAVYMVWLID